jgi:hypothetical protein
VIGGAPDHSSRITPYLFEMNLAETTRFFTLSGLLAAARTPAQPTRPRRVTTLS